VPPTASRLILLGDSKTQLLELKVPMESLVVSRP
jgi:hypothetical protein